MPKSRKTDNNAVQEYDVEEVKSKEGAHLVLSRNYPKGLYSTNRDILKAAIQLLYDKIGSSIRFEESVINEDQGKTLCRDQRMRIRLDKQGVVTKELANTTEHSVFTFINTQLQVRGKSISVVHIPIRQDIPTSLLAETHKKSITNKKEYFILHSDLKVALGTPVIFKK